jgi:hypothetical protein
MEQFTGICSLVSIGLLILMMVYEFGKWLFSSKVELSTLAKLIISQLNYPSETMCFKDGYYGSTYCTDPAYYDHCEIETPHSVMVKRVGFWGYINCFFQGENVTHKLTWKELSAIDKVYNIAVKNKRKYMEEVKNKKYEAALVASQKTIKNHG